MQCHLRTRKKLQENETEAAYIDDCVNLTHFSIPVFILEIKAGVQLRCINVVSLSFACFIRQGDS